MNGLRWVLRLNGQHNSIFTCELCCWRRCLWYSVAASRASATFFRDTLNPNVLTSAAHSGTRHELTLNLASCAASAGLRFLTCCHYTRWINEWQNQKYNWWLAWLCWLSYLRVGCRNRIHLCLWVVFSWGHRWMALGQCSNCRVDYNLLLVGCKLCLMVPAVLIW